MLAQKVQKQDLVSEGRGGGRGKALREKQRPTLRSICSSLPPHPGSPLTSINARSSCAESNLADLQPLPRAELEEYLRGLV